MVELQFITHYNGKFDYITSAAAALEGGCRWIQLRMKDASDDEIIANAKEIRKMCDRYGARFLIDDHVDLVVRCGADGVHLGRNDMPVAKARDILGKDKIIGGTANTIEDIRLHYRSGASYIGCGPFRFTTTKKNLSTILGTEGYRDIIQTMKAENIRIPIVAIGGIGYEDISEIMETGVTGIALSGSILNAEDPVAEMKRISLKISGYGTDRQYGL